MIGDRANQQAAVATAEDRKLVGVRVIVFDQVLASRDKIVEDVLLVQLCPGLVLFLAVLATAAQICHRINTTHLHPG